MCSDATDFRQAPVVHVHAHARQQLPCAAPCKWLYCHTYIICSMSGSYLQQSKQRIGLLDHRTPSHARMQQKKLRLRTTC